MELAQRTAISRTPLTLTLALLTLVAPGASAQTTTAAYVRSRVRDGQTVWVTAADGSSRRGRVAAISDSQFEVSILGRITPFRWADIRMIEVSDSLKNGLILGGIIGGLALAQVPSPRTAASVSAWAALGTGVGAAVGGYADYLREGRDVILRSGAPTASIAPILLPRTVGLRAVVRW